MVHVSVSFVCSSQSNMTSSNVQFILLFEKAAPPHHSAMAFGSM